MLLAWHSGTWICAPNSGLIRRARDLHTPARFALVPTSARRGLPRPIDDVCVAVHDLAAVAADTRESIAAGFLSRLAIHPDQLPAIHEALRPGQQQLDWARRVLAVSEDSAAAVLDGAMVERPVMLRARCSPGHGSIRRFDRYYVASSTVPAVCIVAVYRGASASTALSSSQESST